MVRVRLSLQCKPAHNERNVALTLKQVLQVMQGKRPEPVELWPEKGEPMVTLLQLVAAKDIDVLHELRRRGLLTPDAFGGKDSVLEVRRQRKYKRIRGRLRQIGS